MRTTGELRRACDGSLARRNVRSSGVGAIVGAVAVALVAATDPTIPWAGVATRAALALAAGAVLGVVVSTAAHLVCRARAPSR